MQKVTTRWALTAETGMGAVFRSSLVVLFGLLAFVTSNARAQEFRVRLSARPVTSGATNRNGSPISARRPTIHVDLDAYVGGVLAGEASVLKNGAALQAMAVLARTWAVRYRGRHRKEGYDFCTLTHCQVFRLPGGSNRRYSPDILDAVLSTRNQVLTYRGRLADPYFTADCGGVSESAADLWPDRGVPYLTSTPDPYCAASPHSSWQRTIPLDRVAAVLREQLRLPIRGPIRRVSVSTRDASGRARTLVVVAGGRYNIDANQFRYAVGRELGWDTLKSNLYTVERRNEALVFNGRGLGHGVGLCQAGADAMAGLGIDYRAILMRYFPGTRVMELPAQAGPVADPIASSEHFELAYPETQRRWVGPALRELESWRLILAEQVAPEANRVRVETYNTTAEFIHATGEPGWAGGSTNGRSIFLQPLGTLAAKGILTSTLRHELTHLTLHRLRASGVPGWFEEGFVLYLTGERFRSEARPIVSTSQSVSRSLGDALARPKSDDEMRTAYARAARLVRDLAEQRGTKGLWQLLERPTPSDVAWLRKEESAPAAP